MEILAIIPARGGSKGIPGKNIKLLCGKPLIAYTIEASHNSKYITRTVVSTEDEKIKEVAQSYGAEVVDRPAELAQDETKTAPVMLHVLDELEKKEGYKPDLVILLQATCPLRDENEIDKAFELYFSLPNCDSVFSATRIGVTHARWRKERDGSYKPLYDSRTRPRRQDVDEHYQLYCENGAIYIVKADVMKEVKDFIGYTPEIFVMQPSIDIDEIKDFNRCEEILRTTSNHGAEQK